MVNSHSSINTCAHRYTNTQITCIYRHTWIGAYTYIYASYTSNLTRTRATELNFLSRSDWIEMAPGHFVEKHLTDVARNIFNTKDADLNYLVQGGQRTEPSPSSRLPCIIRNLALFGEMTFDQTSPNPKNWIRSHLAEWMSRSQHCLRHQLVL